MLRIVCDTNTFISGFLFNGPERQLFQKIANGEVLLFNSLEIFQETAEVIQRPKFKLTPKDAKMTLEALKSLCEFIEPVRKIQIIKADPDDDKVLECAAATNAHYIVSGDHHLLDLKQFENTKIVSTNELLEILNKQK